MIESSLLQQFSGYINGGWTGAESGRTLEVRNPATGEHLANVPDMDAAETRTALDAAHAAFRLDSTPDRRRRTDGEQVPLRRSNLRVCQPHLRAARCERRIYRSGGQSRSATARWERHGSPD